MSYNETIDNYLYDEENEYTQANDLWGCFPFQHQHFLAVAIDMQLTGTDNRRQIRVVLHRLPTLMIWAISIHQFVPQVRAHIGRVNVCCVHFSKLYLSLNRLGSLLSTSR